MAVVAGVLGDEAQQDPAQRELGAVGEAGAGVVEGRRRRDDLAGALDLGPPHGEGLVEVAVEGAVTWFAPLTTRWNSR